LWPKKYQRKTVEQTHNNNKTTKQDEKHSNIQKKEETDKRGKQGDRTGPGKKCLAGLKTGSLADTSERKVGGPGLLKLVFALCWTQQSSSGLKIKNGGGPPGQTEPLRLAKPRMEALDRAGKRGKGGEGGFGGLWSPFSQLQIRYESEKKRENGVPPHRETCPKRPRIGS
jgi:hypothetical protein